MCVNDKSDSNITKFSKSTDEVLQCSQIYVLPLSGWHGIRRKTRTHISWLSMQLADNSLIVLYVCVCIGAGV